MPKVREEFKQLKDTYGTKSLGEYTVGQVSSAQHTPPRRQLRRTSCSQYEPSFSMPLLLLLASGYWWHARYCGTAD